MQLRLDDDQNPVLCNETTEMLMMSQGMNVYNPSHRPDVETM